jgi:hypothetical protein
MKVRELIEKLARADGEARANVTIDRSNDGSVHLDADIADVSDDGDIVDIIIVVDDADWKRGF